MRRYPAGIAQRLQVLRALPLRNNLLKKEATVMIEKHLHELAPKLGAFSILGADKALPNGKVQPAMRIRFLNLFLGKQHGRVSPRHAFRELRTDPQEWRRFQLT